jgi:putative addiction module component (TIGR02574 family)
MVDAVEKHAMAIRRRAELRFAMPAAVAYPQAMEFLTDDEIARLSPPERLALIAQLWDSLEHDHLPLADAQQAELERRLASLDQDRRDGVTWAALKIELDQRCP